MQISQSADRRNTRRRPNSRRRGGCRPRTDRPCTPRRPDAVLRDELEMPGPWFETIRMNLSAIAATLTDRRRASHPAPRITQRACAHGDSHAANLTTGPTILDREGWGTAPRALTPRLPTPSPCRNRTPLPASAQPFPSWAARLHKSCFVRVMLSTARD
ncbi:hypothetical protein [Streptomyces mirabilis]|uniref:hypothetical protein n=1 Tax=Streptomyces mirabilis TaxID=68239 RepID=UPI0036B1A29B